MSAPANDTRSSYARIKSMRSPATVAALDALVQYRSLSPDPRDPDHAPTLKRLQTAYTDAAQADGSFFAALADERDGFAEKQEAYALDYPDHAESYLAKAARFREGAQEARDQLAEVLAPAMLDAA